MINPLIAYLSLFKIIPDADADLITGAFKSRIFKENEVLFGGDGICREMFFVCDGILRILTNNALDKQSIHYFISNNRFCTLLNSFNNQVPANERIEAACTAKVLFISRINLLKLYQELPYLKILINQITQQALLDKMQIRNAYHGLDAVSQYQLFLTQQPDVANRVSQADIASYLGITPQSLSRIRKNVR